MRTNKHLHQIYAEHQWTVCSLIDYDMLCFKALHCLSMIVGSASFSVGRTDFFSDWQYPDTVILGETYTQETLLIITHCSKAAQVHQIVVDNKQCTAKVTVAHALLQTNLEVNALECIFKMCVIGSIFTRLYCVESSSTWTLYVVVLQMVGVVLIGAAQLDLFIITLSIEGC